MITRKHKNLKGITKENLRDNISTLELVLNMLAEATIELSKTTNPKIFKENLEVSKSGGEATGVARKEAERRTGKSVIPSKNATELNQVVVG